MNGNETDMILFEFFSIMSHEVRMNNPVYLGVGFEYVEYERCVDFVSIIFPII